MDKTINVVINPIGGVKVEANGFSGASCTDATKAIESALAGSGSVERVEKPEFFNPETTGEHEEQRIGF